MASRTTKIKKRTYSPLPSLVGTHFVSNLQTEGNPRSGLWRPGHMIRGENPGSNMRTHNRTTAERLAMPHSLSAESEGVQSSSHSRSAEASGYSPALMNFGQPFVVDRAGRRNQQISHPLKPPSGFGQKAMIFVVPTHC